MGRQRLLGRLERIAGSLGARARAAQLSTVVAVPLGSDEAEGLPVGLHRAGPAGSTSGLLVYDPANGPPEVPVGALAPWGLVIACEPPVGNRGA